MLLFALTIFTSAFLLFQVQPLIARFILPWFGGAPAVWTTCMLFFQVVLLLGYLYADLLTRWLRPRNQVLVHTALAAVALLLLPIIPADHWKPEGSESPTLRILLLLAASIGLQYFLLSTTGPLIQAWFARRFVGRSPYRLFALSNFGSLLALISYPLVFESLYSTRSQAAIWGNGFIAFAILVVATGFYSLGTRSQDTETVSAPDAGHTKELLGWSRVFLWLTLSMIPSVLLLATTNQICQEVAVVPFLWILPLSLYLISFIVCFDRPQWYSPTVFGSILIVSTGAVIYCFVELGTGTGEMYITLVSMLVMLFSACMTCHGELARRKPATRHLTVYYLVISIGGALGGMFVVLAAPMIFTRYYELHLSIFAAVAASVLVWIAARDWGLLARVAGLVSALVLGANFTAMFFDAGQEFQLENLWVRISIIAAFWILTIAVSGWLDGRRQKIPLTSLQVGLAVVWSITLAAALTAITVGLFVWPEATINDWRMGLTIFLPLFVIFVILFRVRFGWPGWWANALGSMFGIGVIAGTGIFLISHATKPEPAMVYIRRDFYGLLKIKERESSSRYENGVFQPPEGTIAELINGRILHGFEYLREDLRLRITSYYGENSGVGLAVSQHPARLEFQPISIGVVGLGTGTMAAWTRIADTVTFYEINPAVIEIANSHFHFLDESEGLKEFKLGDARIQMERQVAALEESRASPDESPSGIYDVLAIDAFSSDAIPRHLLTAESFAIYLKLLKRDGILAVHVSNHYLDLRPITYSLAEQAGWQVKTVNHSPRSNSSEERYESGSTWILVSNNEAFWSDPLIQQRAFVWDNDWRIHWTDDFGSLVQVLRAPKWMAKPPTWWPWPNFWLRRED